MSAEVHGLPAFHDAPLGLQAARLVGARIAALWPDAARRDVAGYGWAAPYLDALPRGTGRRLLLHPAGADSAPGARVLESHWPLPDRCLDGIVLCHALEASPNPRALLRECWRVLRDDGRLILVVPNRLGPWSLFEHTPFGQGRPWSPGQATRLLEAQMFRVERRDAALFQPPFPWRWALGLAPLWEAPGRRLLPRFAGVLILEAEKDLFAPLPAGAVAVRRRIYAPVRGVGAAARSDARPGAVAAPGRVARR